MGSVLAYLCKDGDDVVHCKPEMLVAPLLPCMQDVWPLLKSLKWIYSSSAGLEGLLFPELIESPVQLTNAKVMWSDVCNLLLLL